MRLDTSILKSLTVKKNGTEYKPNAFYVKKNGTYYKVWSGTHTVTWLNYDGSVLQTKEIEDGGSATYTGSVTPSRPQTNVYYYTWSGWNQSTTNVTEDMTVSPTFTQNYREYTISVSGSNITTSGSGTFHYGDSYSIGVLANSNYYISSATSGYSTTTSFAVNGENKPQEIAYSGTVTGNKTFSVSTTRYYTITIASSYAYMGTSGSSTQPLSVITYSNGKTWSPSSNTSNISQTLNYTGNVMFNVHFYPNSMRYVGGYDYNDGHGNTVHFPGFSSSVEDRLIMNGFSFTKPSSVTVSSYPVHYVPKSTTYNKIAYRQVSVTGSGGGSNINLSLTSSNFVDSGGRRLTFNNSTTSSPTYRISSTIGADTHPTSAISYPTIVFSGYSQTISLTSQDSSITLSPTSVTASDAFNPTSHYTNITYSSVPKTITLNSLWIEGYEDDGWNYDNNSITVTGSGTITNITCSGSSYDWNYYEVRVGSSWCEPGGSRAVSVSSPTSIYLSPTSNYFWTTYRPTVTITYTGDLTFS